jgi:hypothetical protein
MLDRFYQKEAENNEGKETRVDVQEAARNSERSYSIGGSLGAFLEQLERGSDDAAAQLRDSE